jgi:hypothetical protein
LFEFGFGIGFGIGCVIGIGFFIGKAFNWCAAVYSAWVEADDVVAV